MQTDKFSTQRTVWYYYAFQFFFSLLFWVPIFYEYQKRIGLSDTEIFSIQSAYYVAFALMEIPTGMLADRLGYRFSLKVGAILLVVANLLPIYMQDYPGFYMHFMLIALSRSLISGASSAYLYDFLQLKDASVEYKRFEGRARSYSLLGKVLCWAAVGALMQWHLTLPYWLTVVASAISVIFAYALPKFYTLEKTKEKTQSILQKLGSIFGTLISQPTLVLVMVQGIAVFVLVRILQVNLFQPILGSKEFSLIHYGMVMSAMTLFEALGSAQLKSFSRFAPSFFSRFKTDKNLVSLFTLIMALSVFAIPFCEKIGTLISLMTFSFATGFIFPVQRQLMNDRITTPQYRATLLSIESIMDRVVCAVAAWALGDFMASGRLDEFLLYSSIISIVIIFLLFFAFRYTQRKLEVRTV